MNTRRVMTIGVVSLALLASSARADWRFYFAHNNFVAATDGEPHPKRGRVAVASDLVDDHFGVAVCACYVGNFEAPQNGKMIARGEVVLADGSRESFRFKVRVKNSAGENCELFGPIDPESVISMTFDFKGFDSLRVPTEETPESFFAGALVIGHRSGPPPSTRKATRALVQRALGTSLGGEAR